MATDVEVDSGRRGGWRIAMWGGAACLLLLPAVAMQLTREVSWGPGDFIIMGAMLLAACGAFELATRLTRGTMHRAVAGIAILGIFLLIWVELAIGIFD